MNEETAADARVTLPEALYVDALGYVWQPSQIDGHISMARTTTRNLPSPDLIVYLPVNDISSDKCEYPGCDRYQYAPGLSSPAYCAFHLFTMDDDA